MSSPCLLFEHVSISPGVLVSPTSRVLKCSRHRCQQGIETIAVIVLFTCSETAFFLSIKSAQIGDNRNLGNDVDIFIQFLSAEIRRKDDFKTFNSTTKKCGSFTIMTKD